MHSVNMQSIKSLWTSCGMFVRHQSTHAITPLLGASKPPTYTLTTLRAFPSLEPVSFMPVPMSVLGVPLRRDILWRAVVYENDNKRVGSSNPPSRSENGYSRRKLLPQKGTGRARVGDANSPTRHGGGRAHARSAPNDYTTKLPRKIYSQAFSIALSHQYRQGNMYAIGLEESGKLSEGDLPVLDLLPSETNPHPDAVFETFLNEFGLQNKRLLFIIDEPRPSLMAFTESFKDKVDIVQKEFVDVNDILRAHRIFIESEALKYLAVMHSS